MADAQTSEVVGNLHQSAWDCEIVDADRSSRDEQLLIQATTFAEKKPKLLRGGRLEVKTYISFYER
jgi:hypothetical protein